ncbi:hypothetical protein Hypma_006259 [Hypsizygus marmoreus]|uniref:Uncharacterized protein n=1 Tax=Hypsizygus marmoreus TaxID=39966 RepID=A0A369K1M0_HYPMA|nr:hypothetical protein Hypma_006259 [Hypsizygus marmoreus]
MGHLAADIGYPFTIATYVIVGSTGAFIWDLLANMESDHQLLFKYDMAFPTVVYFLSRISVLASTLVNAVIRSAPLGAHCQRFQTTACVLYHIAFSSTALLFFLRVRAIFNRNVYVVAFFFVLWLAVLGGSATVATVGGSSPLGPTKYCLPKPTKMYISASPITLAVHDTLVFAAISWRILSHSWLDPNMKPALKAFVTGRYLPAFSRALLQDGQVYYLVTIVSNLIAVITVTLPAVPRAYRFMYVFNCAVSNMMACRVFRHTKFGHFREESISTQRMYSTSIRFASDTDSEATEGQKDFSSLGMLETVPPDSERRDSRILTRAFGRVWYSRVLGGLILASMIFTPVICVYVCLHRNGGGHKV